jgi:excisionase family DNA binding protein
VTAAYPLCQAAPSSHDLEAADAAPQRILVTYAEAAQILAISKRQVEYLVARGVLIPRRVKGTRSVRLLYADLHHAYEAVA